MKRIFVFCLVLMIAAMGASTAQASEQSEVLWTNSNGNVVHNNAQSYYVMLDIEKECVVTSIMTYHYLNNGSLPGTITLYAETGEQWGPFKAEGVEGQGGVKNAYWVADVGEIQLLPGRYAIEDSDQSTWSNNALSDYNGIAELRGYTVSRNPFGIIKPGTEIDTEEKEDSVFTDTRGNEVTINGGAEACAVEVISFDAGSPWTSDSRANDPTSTLGTPDFDSSTDTNYLCLGSYGSIILRFDRYIVDGDGIDIYVFEIGSSVEGTRVEVSNDLSTWYYVGDAEGSKAGVDLNGNVPEGAKFNYVRITDRDGGAGGWAGADIDAVVGLYTEIIERGADIGTESDIQSLLKKAEDGDVTAQYDLGNKYYYGTDVKQDYEKATEWYRKAAEQGYARAQGDLGWMYDSGRGVSQDDEQAVAWYHKAAEQGNAGAQCNLGWMYDSGRGVLLDDKQAVAWYRKAAEQGYARAQCNLGLMYEYGEGVPQDDEQAVAWYRKAAEQGYARAQYNLGLTYEYGRGVEKDIDQAITWYELAAQQGYENALERLEILQ